MSFRLVPNWVTLD